MTKPKIIAVLNPKGGCGKTTIAINLAHSFKNKGYKVMVVDSDVQGSARDWSEENKGSIISVIGLDRISLEADLESVKNGYDIIIIDGASQVSLLTAVVIKVSDFILIPVQPSPFDLWAVKELVNLIKERRMIADNKPEACFVISLARKNTKFNKEIEEPLKEFQFELLKSRVIMREKYKTCMSEGGTVYFPFVKEAAEEIDNIRNEIIEVLDGIKNKK
jgi:chromosome partitioning protein